MILTYKIRKYDEERSFEFSQCFGGLSFDA